MIDEEPGNGRHSGPNEDSAQGWTQGHAVFGCIIPGQLEFGGKP